MRADRFGSYSIAATLAGMSNLFLRKSIIRYFLLCPPPPFHRGVFPRLFPGFFLVSSSFVRTVMDRTPGEVGLNFLMPMAAAPCLVSRVTRLRKTRSYRPV